MNKRFHFDTPHGGSDYTADAAIVWCFDYRFELAVRKFLKRTGIATVDSIRLAGGARCLAVPEENVAREFVLAQIRTSMRLHATKRVILMLHCDCGAYGGLAAFDGDTRAEAAHHEGDLRQAVAKVKAAIPGIEVAAYFVNFEGLWEIQASAPESAAS